MSLRPSGPPITGQLTVASKLPITDAVGTGSAKVSALITARGHGAQVFRVKALAGNTGKVYLGDTNVTAATGDELVPGESVSIDHPDPSVFYVIAATVTDKISVTVVLAG
jgi:hypothetical protein